MWTELCLSSELDGNPTIYNKHFFLPRAMPRFPLITFHCWFSNFTSCPCLSNCLTEIKLFVKLGTTLTSFKVQKPTGVFNTMSPMPVLLSASLTFPKSPITVRICGLKREGDELFKGDFWKLFHLEQNPLYETQSEIQLAKIKSTKQQSTRKTIGCFFETISCLYQ